MQSLLFGRLNFAHVVIACALAMGAPPRPALSAPQAPAPLPQAGGTEAIYQQGLKNGWQDYGWAHRTLVPKGPARLNMSRWAGWIMAHPHLENHYTKVSLRLKAPKDFGEFLEVRLGMEGAAADAFAHVPLTAQHATSEPDGWQRFDVPIAQLNANNQEYDRVIIRAHKQVAASDVLIDDVVLTVGTPQTVTPGPKTRVARRLQIDCRAKKSAISPYIYGIAFSPRRYMQDDFQWDIKPTIRRWGGNPASRYNWQLGNAWNTASDWFFKNVNYTSKADFSWRDFLKETEAHGARAAMTLPTLGWVAKDTESYSFSTQKLGSQQYSQGDAGNGMRKALNQKAVKIASPAPTTTSVAAPPAFVAQWVKAMDAYQKEHTSPGVAQYILDNEPALWNSTHRDVHPEALSYDELLQRTLDFGEAVRQVAPNAEIAGPAEWGWPAYFFSAKDQEAGFSFKPDRRAHGDTPLLAWYLRQLQAHAAKHGHDVLDTVDLHFYPQINGVYGHGELTGPEAAKKRLRSTRSLWDPTYKDESWIADTIMLLPRLKALIDANYPGRKISIGEYNFGGEGHISGALALAEALGRFGQNQVHSAYMWTYPKAKTPAQAAFMAYRDYDTKGGHFLSESLQTRMADGVSLFASSDPDEKKVVAVALNLNDDSDVDADIEMLGCGSYDKVRTFILKDGMNTLSPGKAPSAIAGATATKTALSASSLMVIEWSR